MLKLSKKVRAFGYFLKQRMNNTGLQLSCGDLQPSAAHLTPDPEGNSGVDNCKLVVATDNAANCVTSKRALKRMKRWQMKDQQKLSNNKRVDGVLPPKKSKNNAETSEASPDVVDPKDLLETDYYFEKGLRKVHPYYYRFTTYTKGRWIGRKLIDVFTEEFRDYSIDYCQKLIQTERLTVNEKAVNIDYVLQNNDFIVNRVHRHELPVTSDPIEIVEDTESMLVVNKPSSIPVHPCGRYRHNSLVYILAKEHGLCNLRGLHRLDRLTSGLMIFCKTEDKIRELMQQLRDRVIEKNESMECNEPIDVLSHKLGIYCCRTGGKEAKTKFELLSSNGKSSVVLCKPLTGRTHQIRVHLQFLGFPIQNDPIYNGYVWGTARGKGGVFEKSEEQLIGDLAQRHSSLLHTDWTDEVVRTYGGDIPDSDAGKTDLADNTEESTCSSQLPKEMAEVKESTSSNLDQFCRECSLKFKDPQPDQLVMYLHAYSYKGPGWEYSTRLPKWAESDFVDS